MLNPKNAKITIIAIILVEVNPEKKEVSFNEANPSEDPEAPELSVFVISIT